MLPLQEFLLLNPGGTATQAGTCILGKWPQSPKLFAKDLPPFTREAHPHGCYCGSVAVVQAQPGVTAAGSHWLPLPCSSRNGKSSWMALAYFPDVVTQHPVHFQHVAAPPRPRCRSDARHLPASPFHVSPSATSTELGPRGHTEAPQHRSLSKSSYMCSKRIVFPNRPPLVTKDFVFLQDQLSTTPRRIS